MTAESDLLTLRRLARETAERRQEPTTTLHLLLAVCESSSAARELLGHRRIDAAALFEAAAGLHDPIEDAVAAVIAEARAVAERASRGASAPRVDALHVLVALLSNRRSVAFRALAGAGVDVGRLRLAATRIALGLVAAPRPLGRAQGARDRRAEAPEQPKARAARPAGDERLGEDDARPRRPPRAGARARAVRVPLLPPGGRLLPRKRQVEERLPAARDAANGAARAQRPPAGHAEARDAETTDPDPHTASGTAPARASERGLARGIDRTSFPTLGAIGIDVTLAAERGEIDPVVGREDEIERTLDVLVKRHANCPLYVGPPGVGKSSVARGLAARLGDDARRLVELPVAQLLAGTGARGALSERMAALRAEVRGAGGRIVLLIDDIHDLIGNGTADEVMAELKAAMARGELPLVATTTPEEYRRSIESDPVLARRFTVIEIEAPSEEEALLVLEAVAARLGTHHGCRYEPEALAAAVGWSVRYLPGRALPDKAVSVLDLAGARAGRKAKDRGASPAPVVESADVAEIVSELGGVPVERLLESDGERMLALEAHLRERVVGHDEALARIAAVLRRNAAGLRGRRPIGTFLLLGPTGVGKTETAKAIADLLFHARDAMTRLDMSEYAEPHALARLIGAPPGYVGHEAGGMLTEALRRRPYQVLLLDEIEKAHRDVLEAFLQVFDEGRITDGRGRTVDATNAVIVLTSNLGGDELRALATERRVGFGTAPAGMGRGDAGRWADAVVRAARAALAPELYNRFDEVLFFAPLEREHVAVIARRLLAALGESLAARGVRLQVDDGVVDALLRQGGWDAELGARPVRRALARHVEAPLAELLLRGELPPGSSALVGTEGEAIVVDVVPATDELTAGAA
jgi:ATP-dependent Clp protease ATP-binding subunit ClpC